MLMTPGMPWRPQDTAVTAKKSYRKGFTSPRENGIVLHKAGTEETAKFFATECGTTGFELGSAGLWSTVPK